MDPPLTQGSGEEEAERMREPEDEGERCEMLSSGHDMAARLTNPHGCG